MTIAAQVGRERALEDLHLGSAGQLSRTEYIGDRGNALVIDRRTRKRKKGYQAELLETRKTPAQISAIPSTLAGAMLSPSHTTDTAATTT